VNDFYRENWQAGINIRKDKGVTSIALNSAFLFIEVIPYST